MAQWIETGCAPWPYEDHDARRRLEAIIHPLVQLEIWRQANESEAAGVPCLVFDVPLLVESASLAAATGQSTGD
jgi:dephospho-CoA kinase